MTAFVEGPRADRVPVPGAERHPGWSAERHLTGSKILIVSDDDIGRKGTASVLRGHGYEVSFADTGAHAFHSLQRECVPDLIVLDLSAKGLNEEFRTIQKDDPTLGLIPVILLAGDSTARALHTHAHLNKPPDATALLSTVSRLLLESRAQCAARLDANERLTLLGRLAAGIGHEINNPLAFVVLNLAHSLTQLRPAIRLLEAMTKGGEVDAITAKLREVADLLADCQVGTDRIRDTVSHLQLLSRGEDKPQGELDLHVLIEQSLAMVRNQVHHRAQLVKFLTPIPTISGNGTELGQVFLNLLLNAAQAIPEGNAQGNEIRIGTRLSASDKEVVVEISDSGKGMDDTVLARVFEPFFTTKPVGEGTGLGLSISRQTIADHGGRMTVESAPGIGTTFRVFLPVREMPTAIVQAAPSVALAKRSRVLAIDDEPLIGRIIRMALGADHEVVVAHDAAAAIARFALGETFDLIMCDLVMPDVSGPELYATILQRWPSLAPRVVFMTGGAFTPGTVEFLERTPAQVISKPFRIEQIKRLLSEISHASP